MLNEWLPPLLKKVAGKLSRNAIVVEENEIEDQVYADYDHEYGVVFFPPVYAQRYAAVCDCLMDQQWFGKLEKVLNIGKQHDVNFMKYLTEVPGITQILGLDIECSLSCSYEMFDLVFDDYEQRWEKPLQITLLQGNAADPDYRLIGCDAVVAIDVLERLLPNDIDRLVHNVFGFIKPWVALFTTQNADFNVLLKNLDKNGLRQPDHYFEWTRAQLHDWCSNIVARYPEYVVTSRGVGPGPTGTAHYGCYSQLVIFISKCYKKEMELNVNSLVLVSNPPEPEKMSDIGWVTPTDVPSSHSLLHRLEEAPSSELHFPGSSIEGTPSPSPVSSDMSFKQVDEASQCNLDAEFAKSFVMFNVEDLYQVRMPRQRMYGHVYEIGDVASSLNNTMYAVKQFSKTAQYLIEKNEIDTTSTQDLLEEISQLTDRLICNMHRSGGEGHMWNNVNWGENVPYWNQYYKVVGVYNYPYEGKSVDDIILDLISEEITKVLDAQGIDGMLRHGKQLEIPIDRLMDAVNHITDDVGRVIMLLEDNGYEVDGEAVVHSTVDIVEPSQEDDSESNSEFDITSDGSNFDSDYNGNVLNRTLHLKVRKLQLLLPNDEDLKQALGQVICRLKKIAVRCGTGKRGPARSRWLQMKLLDLLTMTEKSILRRKLRGSERDPLKGNLDTSDDTAIHLLRIRAEDDKAWKIVEKYKNLSRMSAEALNSSERDFFEEPPVHDIEELGLSAYDESTRHTLDEHERIDWDEHTSPYLEETNKYKICDTVTPKDSEHRRLRKESKVKSTVKIAKKTKSSSSNLSIKKSKHSDKHCPGYVTVKNILKKAPSCKALDREIVGGAAPEKVLKKLTFDNKLDGIDNVRNVDEPTFVVSVKSKPIPDSIFELCHPDLVQKAYTPLQKTDAKMEAVSATETSQIIEILTQDETITVAMRRTIGTNPDEEYEVYQRAFDANATNLVIETPSYILARMEDGQSNEIMVYDAPEDTASSQDLNDLRECITNLGPPILPIAVTEKTRIVEILTEDDSEIVALQRTVGTEPDSDAEVCEQELEHHRKLTNSLTDIAPHENVPVWVGKVTSQEFFLYDINEPTTSKGLRHVSMDVQCGTDATTSNYAMLSATTSFSSPFKKFGTGLKIEDSITDTRTMKTDCVTSTQDILKPCGPTSSPWMKCVGIKIKDSCHRIDVPQANDDNERPIFSPFTICKDKHSVNTSFENNNDNIHTNQKIENCGRLENDSKENINNLGSSAIPISVGNTKRCRRPIYHSKFNVLRMKETSKTQESAKAVMRLSNVPNEVRPKLSRGGVHVHSYKDLQLSEDVMFQGEWQRYRPKPSRRALIYYMPKKPSVSSTDKSKFTCKANVRDKSPKPIIVQRPKTAPLTVRNTKSNQLKASLVKRNIQNKMQSNVSKQQVSRPKPENEHKVTSKLATRFSKPVQPKSKTAIQLARPTRLVHRNNNIKENKPPSTPSTNLNPSPSLNKITKRKSASKMPSPSRIKPDTLPNLLMVNNGRKTPVASQTKVGELIDALLKVTVEPTKPVNYVVYVNETETAKCSAAVENITASARPSDKENVLRHRHCNLSRDSSTCSSHNSVATVLNPHQPVSRTKPLGCRRQPLPKKTNISRKGSDSNMLSRFKKLVNKMMITKKSPLDASHVPGTSTVSKSSSKSVAHVVLVGPPSSVFASRPASNKSSCTKSFTKSCDSKYGTDARDKDNMRSTPTVLILNPHKTNDDSQGSDASPKKNSLRNLNNKVVPNSSDNPKTEADYTNTIFDAMKQLVEERLNFLDTCDRNVRRNTDTTDYKRFDFDNITSTESETYETGRTYDARSLGSQNLSFTDVSFKSMPSASKFSECFADNESWANMSPPGDYHSNSYTKERNAFEMKDGSLTEARLIVQGCSTFSMNSANKSVGRQEPDYVNIVDSETGSYAACGTRPSTSEEVLVSDRSTASYVSCVLDEEAVIPTWLFNNASQQETNSFSSIQREVPELVIADPEMPEPFALNFDENGNEIVGHAAGAGDGHGIHSDQSQDSSGQGTSFSSSAESSRAQSESVVVDPATFVEQFESVGEHANTSSVAPTAMPEDSTDTSFITATDNANRIPRSTRRVSLPASDADVSSNDTDVASDI